MAKTKLAEFDRAALQWLLVTGLLACAPLAFELPAWVSATFVAGVAWRYAIERFHRFRPGPALRYALVACVLVAVYSEYGTVLGRDPGLAIIVALLGLKLLELRSRRDAVFCLFLLYVVIIGAFLFGQSLLGAVWALAAVAVSLFTLMLIQQRMPVRAAFRLCGELLLKAVPLMLILYLLFPRINGTLWSLPTDAHAGMTGMSEEVRPGTIHKLSQSSEIAFRVDFAGSSLPPAPELYWRGLVLWHTDGNTWQRGAPAANLRSIRPLGTPVQYRVTLEPSNKPWLFALDLPLAAPEGARLQPDLTLVRDDPVLERINYALVSSTRYTTEVLSARERNAALALPPVSARVRDFVQNLRSSQDEPLPVALAVLEHFRREKFVYTLAPPPLGADPVDEFLFETRRGFCEHYATAFTTLMRAAGIPARLVIGYQGGELNPAGHYLIVRQSDAHAWAEIWVGGRGWVRIDPTTAIAPERIELGSEAIRRLEARGLVPGAVGAELLAHAMELPWFEGAAHRLRLNWDYANLAWYRWVVDYRKERQERLLQGLGFETVEWTRVLITLGGACAAVLIAYVLWAQRAPLRDPVQRRYQRFCRKLARAGICRAPHEGALAFAARAGSARPDLAATIGTITARYLDLRYGSGAHDTGLRELTRAIRAFRTG